MVKQVTDYCQCDHSVPINHLGTCEGCGKKYMFPYSREFVTHSMPFEDGKKLVNVEANKQKKLWGYIRWGDDNWREIFARLYDGEFFNTVGGYFLMGCGIFCNPRLYDSIELYFNDKRGAEFWRELDYSKAMYTVDICFKESQQEVKG